jgi:hypothetical protein
MLKFFNIILNKKYFKKTHSTYSTGLVNYKRFHSLVVIFPAFMKKLQVYKGFKLLKIR